MVRFRGARGVLAGVIVAQAGVVAFVLACSSEPAEPASVIDGGGGQGDPMGGTGGQATGGFGALPGSGGAGGTGGTTTDGGVTAGCGESQLYFTGTLDGVAVTRSESWACFVPSEINNRWTMSVVFGPTETILLRGFDDFDFGDPVEGTPYATSGWARLPQAGSAAPAWYCVGDGSTITRTGERYDFRLKLAKIGTCPGSTVTGSISYCAAYGQDDTVCPVGADATGNVAGVAVETNLAGRVGCGRVSGSTARPLPMWNGHILYFETPEFARSSPVSSGLFAFPIDSAGSSIGYCIDEGSFETAANTYDRAELTKLSALPDCTTATAYDEITGCVLD